MQIIQNKLTGKSTKVRDPYRSVPTRKQQVWRRHPQHQPVQVSWRRRLACDAVPGT